MNRLDGQPRQTTTPEQLAYIVEHYPTKTSVDIEAEIGVRRGTVKSIAARLRLKKDPEALRAIRARAGGREPAPISARRRNDTLRRQKTPFGSHLAVLLGGVRPQVTKTQGRVHRIAEIEEDLAL